MVEKSVVERLRTARAALRAALKALEGVRVPGPVRVLLGRVERALAGLVLGLLLGCGAVQTTQDAGEVDAVPAPDALADASADAGSDAPDAEACPAPIEQPPPCESCCQLYTQAEPGAPICPECRITVAITVEPRVRPGLCEQDEPCCAGVYQGVCP